MTTQARNAASIQRAAVLRWTVLTQRRLSHSFILCWQLYWTHWKPGWHLIAEWRRHVDGWKKHGDKQVVDWAQTAGRFLFVKPLTKLLLALWTCAESFRESAALFKQSQILLVLKPPACLCWPRMIRLDFKLHLILSLIGWFMTQFARIWPLTSVILIRLDGRELRLHFKFCILTDDLRVASSPTAASLKLILKCQTSRRIFFKTVWSNSGNKVSNYTNNDIQDSMTLVPGGGWLLTLQLSQVRSP